MLAELIWPSRADSPVGGQGQGQEISKWLTVVRAKTLV